MSKKADTHYAVVRTVEGSPVHVVDTWDTWESAQFACYRYHQEFKEKGFDESIFEFTVQLVHHYNE